jgi:SP family facilitated glucose transporter-like MFS transporter 3
MNAPENVFPGHSTGEWSIAVASFAIGGPLGAIMGGKWQTSAVDVGRSFAPDLCVLVACCRPCLGYVYYYRVPLYWALPVASVPYSSRSGNSRHRRCVASGTITQFAMVTGILIADLVAFPLRKRRVAAHVCRDTGRRCDPATLVALLLESPRWLLTRTQSRSRRDTLSSTSVVSVTITK